MMRVLLISLLILACQRAMTPQPPSLAATWYANANSINFLNLQHMALDLRADSSYRYFYRLAPRADQETGDDYMEGGYYRVRGDSLQFMSELVNGELKQNSYSRRFRMLPDTAEWPLRVTYAKQGTVFEVYFRKE